MLLVQDLLGSKGFLFREFGDVWRRNIVMYSTTVQDLPGAEGFLLGEFGDVWRWNVDMLTVQDDGLLRLRMVRHSLTKQRVHHT